MMKISTYTDAEAFLRATRPELETQEAKNGLILGICGQLIDEPGRYKAAPCLKTVWDDNVLVIGAVMTPPHKLVLYAHQGDFQVGAAMLVDDLLREDWNIPGVLGPRDTAEGFAGAWAQTTGGATEIDRRSHLFELREVAIPQPENGSLRRATDTDLELVTGWWHDFIKGIFGEVDLDEAAVSSKARLASGDIFLWENTGLPVSIAMKTRPTRNGISLSLVYTPPELRSRGYATACVGELSRMLLAEGRQYCTLFADETNIDAYPCIRAHRVSADQRLCRIQF